MNPVPTRVACTVLTGLALCAALADQAVAESGGKAERPNFLLIVADDLGWTDLGSFGSEIQTPNLDGLAAEGVQFSDFHTSMSCSPTRSMLLSGTDNHIAGLGNMGELLTPEQRGQPGYEGYLNDRVASLAEVLQAEGYRTLMAGKWHLGHEPEQFPRARGFERSFSMLYGGASYWSDRMGLIAAQSPAKYTRDGRALDKLPREFYATRSFTDFLIDAIRESRGDDKPFLAYLAFTAPHDPLHVPEPWLSKYRGRYDDGYEVLKRQRGAAAKQLGLISQQAPIPPPHPKTKAWDSLSDEEKAKEARAMEVYAGLVENMDYHVGRILDFLRDIGELDNTVVIFLSDNGPNPWTSDDYPGNAGSEWIQQFDDSLENIGHPGSNTAYGMGWSVASSGPLDYFKMTVAEGGIRTPLIVAGPGVAGGRRFDGFAYVWDVMPTMLEMAAITHPEKHDGREVAPMRGRSLTGVLSGRAKRVYAADELVGGEMQNGKWMRKGDYKAVFVAKPYGPAVWQLYDVMKDPGETFDLSDEKPELLEEIKTKWDQYARDVGVVRSE